MTLVPRRAPTAEARAKAAAGRQANIAATRPTTRPGAESTALKPGDRVRAARTTPRSGTWARYEGREGYVATVNAQKFPSGATYVEVGVTWTRVADWARAHAEVWFRADELVKVP